MKSRFNAHDIATQLATMIRSETMSYVIHENGNYVLGIVDYVTMKTKGRVRLHMIGGGSADWRLPQSIIDEVHHVLTSSFINSIQRKATHV
jgi:hypothetical protein